ncbi:MAG: hemopexin repeat-containing protein, partial [Smithellaceae bacterium]|nr:hemopexin repeat-containing protein [Smithellaceae bacterium]
PINARTWPGMIWTAGIDDVVTWSNGKAFFFKGNQFIRYDIAADRTDPGYPQPINARTWPGL